MNKEYREHQIAKKYAEIDDLKEDLVKPEEIKTGKNSLIFKEQ
jgi:hypothetical protein